MTIMYVTYSGNAETRFDRDYYVREHVPLVMAAWGQYGLLSCEAFFPADSGSETIAIAECRFRDEAALFASLDASESDGVMADVGRFTDATPVQGRTRPVRSE